MYNQKSLLEIYNSQNENKISGQELTSILPKLYMIINKLNRNDTDINLIIECLLNIKNQGAYDKITKDLIDFIIRIIKSNSDISSFSDFLAFLMIIVLPYNTNYEKNVVIPALTNISFFIELVVNGLIDKKLNKKDLEFLGKYNIELKNIIEVSNEVEQLYRKHVMNDILLKYMLNHMKSLLYMRLEDYRFKYDILLMFICNIINSPNNYKMFVNICLKRGISKYCIRSDKEVFADELSSNNSVIEAEVYKFANEILQYIFDKMNNKEKSGEENEGQYSSN